MDEKMMDACLRKIIKDSAGYFGYDVEELSDLIDVKRATWYRRLRKPSDFTIGEIRKMTAKFHWTEKSVALFLGAEESKPWDI